jgi:hypothetical protein
MRQNAVGLKVARPERVSFPLPGNSVASPSRANRHQGYLQNTLVAVSGTFCRPLQHYLPWFSCQFPFKFVSLPPQRYKKVLKYENSNH